MSNDTEDLPILRVLGLAERSRVTYYACFAHALDNEVGAALFASCFYFWRDKGKDPDGWIYKTQADITKETGMKRSMQETARKKLKEVGILEDDVRGVPGKLYYRFDWPKMNTILSNHFLEMEREEKGKRRAEREAVRQPSIIHAMAAEFENRYFDQADIEFSWGGNKDEKGKQFGCLKTLHDHIASGIAGKKAKVAASQHGGIVPADAQFQASFDEILAAWIFFLDNLPTYFRTNHFSPSELSSRYHVIYNQIEQTRKNVKPEKPRTRAADTV